MYDTIEIDFDVFKEITRRRASADMTANDVLRELLGLPARTPGTAPVVRDEKPWVTKGVTFPHGTEFRTTYKGQRYFALVENGALVVDGESFSSPSAAAGFITGTSINGWSFWECKMPGERTWKPISSYR